MVTKGKPEDLNKGSTPAQGCSESSQVQNGQKTKVLAGHTTPQQTVINTTSPVVVAAGAEAEDIEAADGN